MKSAITITKKVWEGDKLVDEKIRKVCGYCRSTQTYLTSKKRGLYCRTCGQVSKVD